MDYYMLSVFVEKALSGEEFPIDIYDMATWYAVTALSEQSISLGGASVAFPDFTRGKWMLRKRKDVVKIL